VTSAVPTRALLAGASGSIGRALAARLSREGVSFARLVRRAPITQDEYQWDPARGQIDARAFDGVDAVFNLAGRAIATRWTRAVRDDILQSRIRATRLLVDTMAQAETPPRVLVSASGINFYGDRGDAELTESASKGTGFLSDVTEAWEREAARAEERGTRVACTRNGIVLAHDGGALQPMLLPFRLGIGGPLGNGRQWWSWIHVDDVAAALVTAARDAELRGPVNIVGPGPVRNREFVRALAAALHRPAVLPVPAVALRMILGGMTDELVLASTRVIPARLRERGFTFKWPDLEPALRDVTAN
jgi:uncharacterized protein